MTTPLSHLESQYQAACDEVSRIREQYHAGDEAGRRALQADLDAAKQRMIDAWHRCDRAARDLVGAAPADMYLLADGSVRVIQGVPGVGGHSATITRQAPQYDAAVAAVRAQQHTDAQIASIAYDVWGWSGPVRIRYYGTTAVVSRGGGPTVTVDLATMTGQKS